MGFLPNVAVIFVPPVVVPPDIKDNNEEAASPHRAVPLEIHPSFSITNMAATQFIPAVSCWGWGEGGGRRSYESLVYHGATQGELGKENNSQPRSHSHPQTIKSCQSA